MQELSVAELYGKMCEYVKMEDELPFADFSVYYQDLLGRLQASYPELNSEELVQMRGCCLILANNAQMRAAKKDQNRKKFHKMAEKATFWQEAIKARLLKEGMSANELEEKTEGLWAACD